MCIISDYNSRCHPVLNRQILRHECSLSVQTATVFSLLSLPCTQPPQCIQFHCIVSYPHLNVIPFDMSALQAELCVTGSTYLICYPLGSGLGDCSSTRISPPAGTPPPGLMHKQHDSSRKAVTTAPF